MSILGKTRGKETIRVLRSREGTLLEAANAVLLVVLWVVAAATFAHSPEVIPTHFRADGTVDGYGSRAELFIMPAIATLTAAVLLLAAYHPQRMVNMPVAIRNAGQVRLAAQMCRVMALAITAMFGAVTLALGGGRLVGTGTAWAMFWVFFVMVFAIIFFYMWRMRQER